MQRWLAALVADGRLEVAGSGKKSRYHVPRIVPDQFSPSEQSEIVRGLIRRPLSARTPVGYDAAFLEGYRPNVVHYLPAALRERLRRVGRAPGPERPAGTYARQLLGRLLVDLSWASSRLEGNTYTRLDTQNLIELGQAAPGKDQREAQMILNHKAAIEMLVSNVDDTGFNRYTICNLHALLADNLLADASALGRLHEGTLARFRLRPSEFRRWRGRKP